MLFNVEYNGLASSPIVSSSLQLVTAGNKHEWTLEGILKDTVQQLPMNVLLVHI